MAVIETPNEKVCEELFLAYTLQYARSGKLILYAPTQREEYITGYDAALFTGSCRELILQFKRAYSSSDGMYFNIVENHSTHQRDLLQRYPPNSAFYVAGTFESLIDLFNAQADQLTITGFLDRFIAVPAHILIDGEQVRFTTQGRFQKCRYIKRSKSKQKIRYLDRIPGSELLNRFLHQTKFEAGAVLKIDSYSKTVRVLPNPAESASGFEGTLSITQDWLSNLVSNDIQNISTVFIRYCTISVSSS